MNIIAKRLTKTCSLCEREMQVIIYSRKNYRGGHYFGKVPMHTKKAFQIALKAGVKEYNFHGMTLSVMKKSPIPYKYIEYWECPKCYWKG